METRTYQVYKFEELSKEAQAKAIEGLRDINTDYDWHDYIINDWEDKLEKMGYYDVKISFTGFCSQGDGASFTGRLDIVKWLKYHHLAYKLADKADFTAYIVRSQSYYVHEKTTTLELYQNNSDFTTAMQNRIDKLTEEIEKLVTAEIYKLNCEIYAELKEQNEYLSSDEAIIKTIEANDYKFLDNGKIDY